MRQEPDFSARKSKIYDEWQVVQLVDLIAIFPYSPTSHSEAVAEKRAREYAEWKNSQLQAKYARHTRKR